MATLRDLELLDQKRDESVALLVGPNGSGKSTFLRGLAESHRYQNVIVVSNTPHDRFAHMRGIRRISAGRSDHTPPNIVKRAVSRSFDEDDSRFHQISTIMSYCGYVPRFGFAIEPGKRYGSSLDDLRMAASAARAGGRNEGLDDITDDGRRSGELERALNFLRRHTRHEPLWLEADRSDYQFSLSRDFVAVLRCEGELRRHGVIGRLDVLLEREGAKREVIEMRLASSGQLALISSLLFLITEAGPNPIVLIDEPENSLHPAWQSEYVDKLLAAMAYREATIIIATHAPLVVTGAMNDGAGPVAVFRISGAQPQRLEIDASASPSSIEEILWEAFGVVTPANHFVSEEIVRSIDSFEKGKIRKDEVLTLVDELDERSFDPQQKRFFGAVRALVDKVERAKADVDEKDDDVG
jgi:ABC-type transport system involved in cytochrome c biogenesis ATPase subunit